MSRESAREGPWDRRRMWTSERQGTLPSGWGERSETERPEVVGDRRSAGSALRISELEVGRVGMSARSFLTRLLRGPRDRLVLGAGGAAVVALAALARPRREATVVVDLRVTVTGDQPRRAGAGSPPSVRGAHPATSTPAGQRVRPVGRRPPGPRRGSHLRLVPPLGTTGTGDGNIGSRSGNRPGNDEPGRWRP